MIKREESSNPNSCLNRARDDEWIFVLLGRDITTAATIRFWIEERIRVGLNNRMDKQITEAKNAADQIEAEQAKNRS